MKDAADWAMEFKSRQRGGGCGGQTIENMRPMELAELVRSVQVDALRWAMKELDKHYPGSLADAIDELARGGR